MSILDEYLADAEKVFKDIERKDGTADRATLEEADGVVSQLEAQFDADKDSLDAKKRKEISDKISAYKEKLKRAKLFGTEKPLPTKSKEDKSQESLEILEKSRQTLHETEEVGRSTAGELQKQTETMQNTKKNVKEVNEHLNTSNKLLTRMSRWWRG